MVADPVHHADCDPDVAWTTGNAAEAFPGVFTPLCWTFVGAPVDHALRAAFCEIGVFTPDEVRTPERIEDQSWTIFHGRAAGNMDTFRKLADLTPGTSATAVEQQLFGYVRPGVVDNNTMRRYPAILLKAPRAIATLRKRHDRYFAELRTWRLQQLPTVDGLDAAGCRRLLADCRERFEKIMTLHFLATFVGSGVADRLTESVTAAGDPGLVGRLLSGIGSDENDVADDLWELAHGGLDMATFLDRHGYHGPNEGQLDSPSWRERPEALDTRLAEFRAMGADSPRAPRHRSAAQAQVRADAQRELAASMPAMKARIVSRLVPIAARFLVLREQGKAGYLMTFDVARSAARRLGGFLCDDGVLAAPDDVFFLTWDELSAPPTDTRDLVAQRRKRHAERIPLRLPEAWTGVPEPIAVQTSTGARAAVGVQVTGIGACGGVIEGRARVVRDPLDIDLDEGDILVCEATDPSWISLFMVAAGVVTDLGGMLSHGAIVAREMGIPCVCNTKTASTTITDGQRIRLDGARGLVETLD